MCSLHKNMAHIIIETNKLNNSVYHPLVGNVTSKILVWFPWNDNDRGLFQVLNNICRSSSYVYNVVLFSLRSLYGSRVKIENGWFIAKSSLRSRRHHETPNHDRSFSRSLGACASAKLHKTSTLWSHWCDYISIPSTKALARKPRMRYLMTGDFKFPISSLAKNDSIKILPTRFFIFFAVAVALFRRNHLIIRIIKTRGMDRKMFQSLLFTFSLSCCFLLCPKSFLFFY